MGRTKRKRLKKSIRSKNLDSDDEIVALKRWMKSQNWVNIANLNLRLFETTGRGVCSLRDLKKDETLIEVPHALMITIWTLEQSKIEDFLIGGAKFKMHDLLSLFLILEKHHLDKSFWRHYIKSLPNELPSLPWLLDQTQIDLLPKEMKFPITKRRHDFLESWQNVRKSINPSWRCFCCKEQADRVLSADLFTWAYSMVNTRAVYVDPDLSVGPANNLRSHLSDEPCMALCPYLDMFNHSSSAKNDVALEKVDDRWMYRLKSSSPSPITKHEQIFISYGAHDNFKLLVEYGFFVPGNGLDCVRFTLREVLEGLDLKVEGRQYRFLRDRNFADDLYVGADGMSFNLKAVLHVALNEEKNDWCASIFSENYIEEDLVQMEGLSKRLLRQKAAYCASVLEKIEGHGSGVGAIFGYLVDFWRYWTGFLEDMCNKTF